ncbi:hypothetical protein [Sphingorhabdus sp.]|uniref:hypothetical protein n=1 Tax=Sphingorhabdus sp. TaxID=1902408 RepID=UPI0035944825
MQTNAATLVRISIWLLMLASGLVASFWLMLVVVSDFRIWTNDSNAAGIALQAVMITFPVVLFIGLKLSKGSFRGTMALFCAAWTIAISALAYFGAL